jgi:hypothetical protein
MKDKSNKKISTILSIVYTILFIPIIGILFNGSLEPLNGAFYHEEDTDLDVKGWFDRTYQEKKDKCLQNNFGLHNLYVRAYNQLDFCFLKKAHARFVVVGELNYLYETAYIDAYLGKDFIGEKRIEDYVKKLKQVQDTLQKQNKLLLVVFAPGKASFFPEYIPGYYRLKARTSNYDLFSKQARSLGLNHIDFRDYFISQKQQSKYPLYPQFGIHWSNYGSLMAFDSILNYTRSKTNIAIPEMVLGGIDWSDTLQHPDDDIIKGMNLLIEPRTFKMAYPKYYVAYDSTKHKKLKLLTVSDSFWWYIYGTGLPGHIFSENRFWYYNEEMYPESASSPMYVAQADYFSAIRESDVIMILYSESNLYKFGGGFVDMCYETFCKPNPQKEKLQKMKSTIRSTPEWFDEVAKKAQEHNIPVDSMLTLDAIYMLEKNNKAEY